MSDKRSIGIYWLRRVTAVIAGCLTAAGICLAFPSTGVSAETSDKTIEVWVNTPYVVQFGFGSYDIGGLTTSSYRIPLSHTINLGTEKDDWRLNLTGYLGYSHVDFKTELFGPRFSAETDYLFVLPQVELAIPIRKGWTVKPYLAAGVGWYCNGSIEFEGKKELTKDSYGFLYAAGIGNLFEFQIQKTHVSFGSKFGWAEEISLDSPGTMGFATLQNGVEIMHPLGIYINGREFNMAESFTYYYFFPAARFSVPNEPPHKVYDQFEFGVNFGFVEPVKVWILENPRIGASYRFGDGMTGFRLNLGFPF